MKETILVSVLVEIEYAKASSRAVAVDDALGHLTRDSPCDSWSTSWDANGGVYSVGRSRAIRARRTKQRISPRKGER